MCNVLSRPASPVTNSLVVFSAKTCCMHTGLTSWGKSKLFDCCQRQVLQCWDQHSLVREAAIWIHTVMSSKTLEDPSIKPCIHSLVPSNLAEQTSLSHHPIIPSLKGITFSFWQNQRQVEMLMWDLDMHKNSSTMCSRRWTDKTLTEMLSHCGIHQRLTLTRK